MTMPHFRFLAVAIAAICLSAPMAGVALAQTPPPSAAPAPAAVPAATAPAPSVQPPASILPEAKTPSILAALPEDLSPWGMFLSADLVVKGVIIGLAVASVLTWTVWLAKTLELAIARRHIKTMLRKLHEARSLVLAAEAMGEGAGVARTLINAAREEGRQSEDALADREGLKERIALHLQRVEAATGRRMAVGTGLLATIGATAPFVGLFGTVWGIMNSFIGISKMHTTNLAVVAPGIAEALLAIAIGLVAAIPAVVIYNHFARGIGAYKVLVADAASAVLRLASRDLSRVASSAGVRE